MGVSNEKAEEFVIGALFQRINANRFIGWLTGQPIERVWDDLSLHERRTLLNSAIEGVVVQAVGKIGRWDPDCIDIRWRA